MILSLLGTGETASCILCPVLDPLVREGSGYTGDGSVKDCCGGLRALTSEESWACLVW